MAKLPNTGISTSLVGGVLGTTDRSVGGLCTNINVNMWAKYKPTRYSGLNPDLWYQADDKNYGLSYPVLASYLDIPSNIDGNLNGWKYLKPRGEAAESYRLGDFRGYNNDANPPLSGWSFPEIIYANSNVIATVLPSIQDTDALSLKDLNLNNSYFGIYVTKNGDATKKWRVTSDTKVGEAGGSDCTLNTAGFSTGDYTAYPFFSSAQLAQSGANVEATYNTLPITTVKTFTVDYEHNKVVITIEATMNASRQVTYKVFAKSNLGDMLLNNNKIALRFGNKNWDDPFVNGESQYSIPDVTILNKVNTLIAENTITASPLLGDLMKLVVTLKNGTYKGETMVAVPM